MIQGWFPRFEGGGDRQATHVRQAHRRPEALTARNPRVQIAVNTERLSLELVRHRPLLIRPRSRNANELRVPQAGL